MSTLLWVAVLVSGCGEEAAPAKAADDVWADVSAGDAGSSLDAEDISGQGDNDVSTDASDIGDLAETHEPAAKRYLTVAQGFKLGGVLARQYALAPGLDVDPLEVDLSDDAGAAQLAYWLLPEVGLQASSQVWKAPWQPKSFFMGTQVIELEGAVKIPQDVTSVTLAVATVGGVHVRVAGEVVVSRTGSKTVQIDKVQLPVTGAGWLPLSVRYVPLAYQRHLQLWLDTGDGLKPLDATSAAFVATPPAQVNEVKVSSFKALYWHAEVSVSATLPSRVELQHSDGTWAVQDPAQPWLSEQQLRFDVVPGQELTLTVRVTDVWGRKTKLTLEPVSAMTIPAYTKGGLLGDYFGDNALKKIVMSRVDGEIGWSATYDNFESLTPVDNFSVRWTGGLYIKTSGTYTVYFGTDDGQRVWLDGEQVVEDWVGHGTQYSTTKRSLKAGWHVLELHHFDGGGHAAALLEWEGPDMARESIKAEYMGYPALKPATKAPVLVSQKATRVNASTVRVEAVWSAMASVKADFVPMPGTSTKAEAELPADAYVKVLENWGKGAGYVLLTPTGIGGKQGESVKIMVPGL